MSTTTTPLTALALVCSLKPSPAASSSELIAELKSAKYPAYE